MSLQPLLTALRETVAAPTENMQLTLLLLGAAVLLVALLIVLLLLALSLVRKPAPAAKVRIRKVRKADGTIVVQRIVPKVVAPAPKPPRQYTPEQLARIRRRRRSYPWLLAAALVAAFVATYTLSSTRAFCATACHAGSPAVASAAKDPHAKVACAACHEEPLPAGAVANVVTRASFLVAESRGATVTAEGADVPSARCLRCHDAIRTSLSTNAATGVRVSHAEPLAAGMACADCHTTPGHDAGGGDTARGRSTMSVCLSCHDGTKAKAGCPTCHAGDTSKAASADVRDFTNKVRLGPVTDCGGCHQQKTCDSCHGLRMPHTPAFKAGGHARFAAFGGKVTCYRCHTVADCNRCHEPFAIGGHRAGWATEHAKAPATSGCGCHQPKLPPERQDLPFCQQCHSAWADVITH